MVHVLAMGGLTIDWVDSGKGRRGPFLGGNAAYAAVGALLAGADAGIAAVIGDDYPPDLLAKLPALGIGTTNVRVSPGPSFRVLLDDSGPERAISYLPGSGTNDHLDPIPSQLPAHLDDVAVHICAIPTSSQRRLLDAARAATVTTIDTVVIPGQIEPDRDELITLARRASAFLPSREEVESLWPGDIHDAMTTIRGAGVPRVVVKLGPNGSIGADDEGVVRVPAIPVSVIDSTGAGDAYCGAFCAKLAEGEDLGTAMAWGAAAASIVIEEYGPTNGLDPACLARAAERARQARDATRGY